TGFVCVFLLAVARDARPDRVRKFQSAIGARPVSGAGAPASIHGIENGLLLFRGQVLKDLELLGVRNLRDGAIQPKRGGTEAHNGTGQPESGAAGETRSNHQNRLNYGVPCDGPGVYTQGRASATKNDGLSSPAGCVQPRHFATCASRPASAGSLFFCG